MSLNANTFKTDIVYYRAFSKLRRDNICWTTLETVKVIALLTLIPLNLTVLNMEYGGLIEVFILDAVACGLGVTYGILMAR